MAIRSSWVPAVLTAVLTAAVIVGGGGATAGAVVTPAATATTGDLRIATSGLPGGVKANATLSRVGYVVRLTGPTTLRNLKPVVYTLTTTPSLSAGAAYVATPATTKIAVIARDVRTVTITYRRVTAPGSPTALTARPSGVGTTVVTTWAPPANTGGQITGYTATAAPGGRTCTTTGASTCTVTGLTRGVRYTVSVRTRNAAGQSPAATAAVLTRTCITFSPKANLSGCHLAGAKLAGANLAGANLSSAYLAGADLFGVNLTGANLTGTDLTRADLRQGNLTGANANAALLTGANIDRTTLTPTTTVGLRSGGLLGVPATLPSGYRVVAGHLVGRAVDLSGAALGAANLAGVDLSAATMVDTNLNKTNLAGARLSRANMVNVRAVGANFDGAGLDGANLTGANLTTAQARAANLAAANLSGANMDGTDLAGSQAVNADLHGADLTGTNLTDVNLTGANLTRAVGGGATITGTNFTDATLTGINCGAFGGTPAALPTGWTRVESYLFGPGADCAGVPFTNANLDGADLRGVSLKGARTLGVRGTPAFLPTGYSLVERTGRVNIPNCQMGNPYCPQYNYIVLYQNVVYHQQAIVGPGVDLSKRNLGSVVGTDVGGVYPNDPLLIEAVLPYLNLIPFAFTYANLPGANFSNANLTNVTAWSADVADANFTGATLAGATFTGAAFTRANLTGANLSGANLSGATLKDAIARNGNFSNANLHGADLTGADLTGANISGADLTGATWTDGHTCGLPSIGTCS